MKVLAALGMTGALITKQLSFRAQRGTVKAA